MKRPVPASPQPSSRSTPPQPLDARGLRDVRGGVGWGDGNGANFREGGIIASDDWEAPVT